jgi:PTS system nitrogen regulatory IIA component
MMDKTGEPGLIELIKRGGGFRTIPGSSPRELLTNLVKTIDLPPSVNRKALLSAVLEREALMTTAVGNGIALPHPRNPIITESAEQFVSVSFTEQELDWAALDGKPVHTVILIISASPKMHLHTLSRINFFCQQESFRMQLRNRASAAEILKTIEETERTWSV